MAARAGGSGGLSIRCRGRPCATKSSSQFQPTPDVGTAKILKCENITETSQVGGSLAKTARGTMKIQHGVLRCDGSAGRSERRARNRHRSKRLER